MIFGIVSAVSILDISKYIMTYGRSVSMGEEGNATTSVHVNMNLFP
jgi:hypothetical protein